MHFQPDGTLTGRTGQKNSRPGPSQRAILNPPRNAALGQVALILADVMPGTPDRPPPFQAPRRSIAPAGGRGCGSLLRANAVLVAIRRKTACKSSRRSPTAQPGASRARAGTIADNQ